jgi:threonine dehydrogenase-like Zn-dependent dehydrogenase
MLNLPQHSVVSRLQNQIGLTLRSRSAQQLKDSIIAVSMLSAGVCGTDLAIITGARPGQAEVLGHEGVGVVVYAPAGCVISKGTRVIVNPVHSKSPADVIGHSRDGIFCEWFWLESADALDGELLVSCPRDCLLENTELVLAEPVASVLYSLELLKSYGARKLLLIRGSGTIAILAAKLWSIRVGRPAIVVSKSEAYASWLREYVHWPADISVCSGEGLSGIIREYGRGDPDGGILCCTREDAPGGLRLLLDTVEQGAAIDLMAGFPTEYKEERLGNLALDRIRWNNIRGVSSAPPTSVIDRLHNQAVRLIGHRGTSERHILDAVDLLSHRVVSKDDLPRRVVSLKELPNVVGQMIARKNTQTDWIKTIVVFDGKGAGEIIDS